MQRVEVLGQIHGQTREIHPKEEKKLFKEQCSISKYDQKLLITTLNCLFVDLLENNIIN